MSAIAPVVLQDEATVPNTYTFNPQSISGNLATYLDQTSGIPLAYNKLTTSLSRPSKTTKFSKVRIRMVFPELEPIVTEGDAPVHAFDNFADVTFSFHERATLAQRQKVRSVFQHLIQSLDATALVDDLVENLEQQY